MSRESTPSSLPPDQFLKKRHEKFLLRLLDILPGESLASFETSRMTLLFFVTSGLDILGSLDHVLTPQRRQEIIDWIYSLQVQTGFLGSTFLKADSAASLNLEKSVHIAMTYTALATLVILGDDLGRVNKEGILQALKELQNPDGSFMASWEEGSCDMRIVYCAASVCTLLGTFDTIDKDKMTDYIINSQTYEGAFGQGPDLEAHGGFTYCALASLSMLGHLEHLDQSLKDKCRKWCVMRLNESAFNGRPNKREDTCYTFWMGGALKLLNPDEDFVNQQILNCVPYVLSAQDGIVGGLAKWADEPDISPDPLHTYLGLAGLALVPSLDLQQVDPELNITLRAKKQLKLLHQK